MFCFFIAPPQGNVDKIYQACIRGMMENTCTVMNSNSYSLAKNNTNSLVFVAGVGALDARVYQQISEAGDAMCSTISDACRSNWNSAQCKTARQIFLVVD